MLTCYFRSLKDQKVTETDEFRPGVWIYAEKPTESELQQLVDKYELDEGILKDATDYFEVPRFEVDNNIAYLFTRFVITTDEGETTTSPIMLAVGGSFVLMITVDRPSFLDRFLEGKDYIVTTQKTKLFINIMQAINRRYTNALLTIRREVRKNRRNIREIKNRDIIRFVSLEDTLNDFISALVPTNVALRTMVRGKYIELFEEDVDLMEDLQLSNEQLVESAKTIEATITNIRSTYNTIINNNLNQIIRVLTALTNILTIPTIISSIFGMNVAVPGADHPLAFWFIILITALIAASVAFLFVKKEWL